LPFDQKEILVASEGHIKTQLNLEDVEFVKLGVDESDVPERVSDNVTPGKPYLWMR